MTPLLTTVFIVLGMIGTALVLQRRIWTRNAVTRAYLFGIAVILGISFFGYATLLSTPGGTSLSLPMTAIWIVMTTIMLLVLAAAIRPAWRAQADSELANHMSKAIARTRLVIIVTALMLVAVELVTIFAVHAPDWIVVAPLLTGLAAALFRPSQPRTSD